MIILLILALTLLYFIGVISTYEYFKYGKDEDERMGISKPGDENK